MEALLYQYNVDIVFSGHVSRKAKFCLSMTCIKVLQNFITKFSAVCFSGARLRADE